MMAPDIVFVGDASKLRRPPDLRGRLEPVEWLGKARERDPSAIVLCDEALAHFDAGGLGFAAALLRGARSRILIVVGDAPARVIEECAQIGCRVIDPDDLPAALAAAVAAGVARPLAALDATRAALALALVAPLAEPVVGVTSPAAPNHLEPDILPALHRLESMRVCEWCAALVSSVSPLKRICRLLWGRSPGAVLDIYTFETTRILLAEGFGPSEIARSLGYANQHSVERVIARVHPASVACLRASHSGSRRSDSGA